MFVVKVHSPFRLGIRSKPADKEAEQHVIDITEIISSVQMTRIINMNTSRFDSDWKLTRDLRF